MTTAGLTPAGCCFFLRRRLLFAASRGCVVLALDWLPASASSAAVLTGVDMIGSVEASTVPSPSSVERSLVREVPGSASSVRSVISVSDGRISLDSAGMVNWDIFAVLVDDEGSVFFSRPIAPS